MVARLYKSSTVLIRQNFSDFIELTKARLAVSVVFSSLAGYLIAVQSVDYNIIALLVVGGYCMVGASNLFNQIIEKDLDSLMHRTKNRPIPSGRVSVTYAFLLSVFLTMFGVYALYRINPKTALFGAISIFIYACLYTPLKTKTPLSVFVGAFPGAIPFMLGWVAATNNFGIEAITLFAIQFFWQFPHFWALGLGCFTRIIKGLGLICFQPKKEISLQHYKLCYTHFG